MQTRWQRIRHRLHTIVFESDTWAGRAFDVALLIFIVLSVVTIMLESVPSLYSAAATRLPDFKITRVHHSSLATCRLITGKPG